MPPLRSRARRDKPSVVLTHGRTSSFWPPSPIECRPFDAPRRACKYAPLPQHRCNTVLKGRSKPSDSSCKIKGQQGCSAAKSLHFREKRSETVATSMRSLPRKRSIMGRLKRQPKLPGDYPVVREPYVRRSHCSETGEPNTAVHTISAGKERI
jgi:hypothetical protein